MNRTILYLIILTISISIVQGQVSKTSELFLTLKKQDSMFFERGFNQCDLEYLDKAIHKDLIFYHDQSGIQNRNDFFENTKKYICSDPNKKPIRKVEEQSLEVFPLYNNGVLYGAIQSGVHNFYIREPNKEDVHTSRARFTHLYLLENGNWLLKEVLSFDHNGPTKSETEKTFEKEIEMLLVKEKAPALGVGIIQNRQLIRIQVFGNLKDGVSGRQIVPRKPPQAIC